MADATKELKLKVTVEAPDTAKAADAFKRVGEAAKDAQAQVNKLSLAQRDALRQEQRLGGVAGLGAQSGIALPGAPGSAREAATWGHPHLGQLVPGAYPRPSPGAQPPSRPSGQAIAQATAIGPSSAINFLGHPPMGGPAPALGEARHAGAGIGGGASILAVAGKSLGAVVATAAAVSSATEAIAAMHNPLLTTNQRFIEAAKAVPILGGALGELTSSVLRSAERLSDWRGSLALDEKRRNHPFEMREYAAYTSGFDRTDALARETRNAGYAYESVRKFPTLASLERPLAAVAGFGAFGAAATTDPRIRDAREAEQTARRELHTVRLAVIDDNEAQARQRGVVANAEARYNDAVTKRMIAGRNAGVGGGRGIAEVGRPSFSDYAETWLGGGASLLINGGRLSPANQRVANAVGLGGVGKSAPHEDALLDEERRRQEYERELNKLQQDGVRNKERYVELLQKENELRKAGTNVMRAQLSVAEERLAQSRSLASTYGGMNSVEKVGIQNAANRYLSMGREGVSDSEFSKLQNLPGIGDKIRKDLANEAATEPGLQDLFKKFGIQNLKDQEDAVVKIRGEIAVKAQLDEEQAKKLFKESVAGMNDQLSGIIRKIVMVEIGKINHAQAAGQLATP